MVTEYFVEEFLKNNQYQTFDELLIEFDDGNAELLDEILTSLIEEGKVIVNKESQDMLYQHVDNKERGYYTGD